MSQNKKICVLCLDAGGTNFVFSALQSGIEIKTIKLPSNGDNLDRCIETIFNGFESIINQTNIKPDAISFAFPGPADFRQGIIGDLANLKGFRGGVPLAAILRNRFNLPVYINNDGDLYALGEALSGTLPEINSELKKTGNNIQYRNIVGLTLGTGFGAGFINNYKLMLGDNMSAAEIWTTSNRINPSHNSEEGISIRAIRRFYSEYAKIDFNSAPQPLEIYQIAIGKISGNSKAAKQAFFMMGKYLGDAIANIITLTDGLVVIGGGLAGAKDYITPGILKELNNDFIKPDGGKNRRLTHKVYYLNNDKQKNEFLKDESKVITIPETGEKLKFNSNPKSGFIFSKYNTSQMINNGAYIFAKQKMLGYK